MQHESCLRSAAEGQTTDVRYLRPCQRGGSSFGHVLCFTETSTISQALRTVRADRARRTLHLRLSPDCPPAPESREEWMRVTSRPRSWQQVRTSPRRRCGYVTGPGAEASTSCLHDKGQAASANAIRHCNKPLTNEIACHCVRPQCPHY